MESRLPLLENWRDIPLAALSGRYQVSDSGRIRSVSRLVPFGRYNGMRPVKGRILKLDKDKQGYLLLKSRVNTKTRHFLVHRLVALAFLGQSLVTKAEVNHKDGVKANNCTYNLEWLTHSENERQAYATGLKKSGNEHHLSKDRKRPWVSEAVKAWWSMLTPEERSARAHHTNMVRWHGKNYKEIEEQ